MFVIFTAQAPFKGKTEEELFYEIQNKIPNFNRPSLKNVSIEAKDLILRLLDKNNQTRPSALDALDHPWFKLFKNKKEIANQKLSLFINNLKSYKNDYKLQQAAIAVIVHNIPANDEIKELEKAFRVIDENGDGHLNHSELVNGFVRVFNKNLDEATSDVERIFKIVDADRNGVLEYEEFIRACIDKKTLLNDTYLRLAFNFFDRDESGSISLKEMKEFFCGGNYTVGLKVLEKVISEVDINHDGQVSFEEFKVMMDKFIK
jgi:calcium-dependent protein kinase